MRHLRASLFLLTCAFALSILCLPASASQFGRDGFSGNPGTNGGATCTACHASAVETPTLSLFGPTIVGAGVTATYTATLVGGPGVTGGIDVSATDAIGSFLNVDADLAPIGDEIAHAQPKPFDGGLVRFTFQWTAPTFNGEVTLYAAGNSSDGQLDLLGDGIAATQLLVNVVGGDPPPPPEPPPGTTRVALEAFASDLGQPVALANAGDDRLFVAERAGRVLIVESDGSVLDPYLDIQSAVDSVGSEQGLLGLAFHPDHASNGFFYVYYTVDPGPGLDRSRVSRFTVSADPNVADPASEVVLLEFEQPYANHNGGDIQFGPDGHLYIASGDGGSGGDPLNLGQTTSSLLGKILRIDVDGSGGAPDCDLSGGANYSVPPGNAFEDGSGGAGCDEIWALGLRNPWRFSFDRATGDLWIADVGQNAFEEIDFIPAGTASGLNLGWRCYEGESAFNTAGCGSGYFMPILTPAHGNGNCSITGGFVYRGASEPGLTGRYFFTDFCNTAIRTVTRDGSGFVVDEVLPAGAIAQPAAFGEDSAGELYVASLAGDVFRIRDNSPRDVPALGPWSVLALAAAMLALPRAAGRLRAARRNSRRSPHP